MNIQIVRAVVAVVIIALGMLTPLLMPVDDQLGSDAITAILGRRSDDTVYAQDDDNDDDEDDDNDDDGDDEDNDDGDDDDNDDDDDDDDEDDENDDGDEDNNDDEDNDDSDDDDDNSDDDDDNEDDEDNEDGDDEDNEDDDDDNDDDGDNVVGTTVQSASDPGPTFDLSVTQASGVTTGADGSIALPADRIAVRVFPGMPQGITLTIRVLNKASFPSAPGAPVIALIFQVEARNAAGANLTVLPAEVNVSARYMNSEIAGLNKTRATFLWFNPATNQWGPAPKLLVDPTFNYVGSSTTGAGYYCVCLP